MNDADRELLELAAKAVGRLGPHGNPNLDPPNEKLEFDGRSYWFWPAFDDWNPLTDDSDALRLAVNLNMGISIHENHCMACAHKGSMQTVEGVPTPEATRRAIVRAAAEIGRDMP